MKRRFVSLVMALMCLASLGVTPATAVETRASKTISDYRVTIVPGSNEGEIRIAGDIFAVSTADSLGISSIKIYKSDQTYVTTIYGSSANGLIRTGSARHACTYTFTGVSGTTYYADVTVFASIGSDYDSRTVQTNSVTAP